MDEFAPMICREEALICGFIREEKFPFIIPSEIAQIIKESHSSESNWNVPMREIKKWTDLSAIEGKYVKFPSYNFKEATFATTMYFWDREACPDPINNIHAHTKLGSVSSNVKELYGALTCEIVGRDSRHGISHTCFKWKAEPSWIDTSDDDNDNDNDDDIDERLRLPKMDRNKDYGNTTVRFNMKSCEYISFRIKINDLNIQYRDSTKGYQMS
eukprot:75783_1